MIDYGVQHWDHVITWEVWKIERRRFNPPDTQWDHDVEYARKRGDWT